MVCGIATAQAQTSEAYGRLLTPRCSKGLLAEPKHLKDFVKNGHSQVQPQRCNPANARKATPTSALDCKRYAEPCGN
jgi:hypothetical protein